MNAKFVPEPRKISGTVWGYEDASGKLVTYPTKEALMVSLGFSPNRFHTEEDQARFPSLNMKVGLCWGVSCTRPAQSATR